MQGYRPHMQDDFSCSPSENIKGESFGFFGVFDGHGQHGEIVSQYCAEHFIHSFLERKTLRNSKVVTPDTIMTALGKTFVKFDSQLKEAALSFKPPSPEGKKISFAFSGTTATVALVLQDLLIIANVGDSRTILCRNGAVSFSTTDHNPGIDIEDERIIAAGGKIHTTPSKHKVILDPEAYTNLAVSRTLGDFNFKKSPQLTVQKQIVSPIPDITEIYRDHKTDEFLILASDGIFKSMSSQDAVQFIQKQLQLTEDLSKIAHNLLEMAYFSVSFPILDLDSHLLFVIALWI